MGDLNEVRLNQTPPCFPFFEEIGNFGYLYLMVLDYLRKSESEKKDYNLNLGRWSSGSEAQERPDYTKDLRTETLQTTSTLHVDR